MAYLHSDREQFRDAIDLAYEQTGVMVQAIEKDYYVTMLLRLLAQKIRKIASAVQQFVDKLNSMRNKAGLLFVYWKVLDGRPRKLQKIPPAAELQTVRNYSLFRKPSRTLFHFSGYS